VRVFFDNCVSPHVGEALRCLDRRHELVHLRDRFDPATPDTEWISQLGVEGDWIIISGDPRISRGLAERSAWIESGLTAFFCGDSWGSRKLMIQASELFRLWDDILERAKSAPKGSTCLSSELVSRGKSTQSLRNVRREGAENRPCPSATPAQCPPLSPRLPDTRADHQHNGRRGRRLKCCGSNV